MKKTSSPHLKTPKTTIREINTNKKQ